MLSILKLLIKLLKPVATALLALYAIDQFNLFKLFEFTKDKANTIGTTTYFAVSSLLIDGILKWLRKKFQKTQIEVIINCPISKDFDINSKSDIDLVQKESDTFFVKIRMKGSKIFLIKHFVKLQPVPSYTLQVSKHLDFVTQAESGGWSISLEEILGENSSVNEFVERNIKFSVISELIDEDGMVKSTLEPKLGNKRICILKPIFWVLDKIFIKYTCNCANVKVEAKK